MFCRLEGVSRRYGGATALDSVTLAVEPGELVSLVGPSGAGKTTLLKILAGLDAPSAGQVIFAAEPSLDNPVILVFQDYLLFPGLTVFENTAFGLRARKRPKAEIAQRVGDILAYFHLADRAHDYPAQLSGGQKQRVALARAMVVNPALLLLDEPFAHLDRNLKIEAAEFIRATQRAFGITTVCVTHDLEEAFVMSDRIGILLSGSLVQYDAPKQVYEHPATREAALFLGPVNTLDPGLLHALGLENEARAGETLYARPEALRLDKDPAGPAVVEDVQFAGQSVRYRARVLDRVLLARACDNGLFPGDRARVVLLKSLFPPKETP